MPKESSKQRVRRRRCVNCRNLFSPNSKSAYHQKFCSAVDCKNASKAKSQKQWREKLQNQGYWRGPEHVERVRAWRRARAIVAGKGMQLRNASSEPVPSNKSWPDVNNCLLQDDLLPRDPLILGVISALAGSSLQDDIAVMCKHLIRKGREILEQRNARSEKRSAAVRS